MRKIFHTLAPVYILVFLVLQIIGNSNVFAVDQAAIDAMQKAQETIIVLEDGLEKAEELLQKIKDRGTDNEYRVAREIKEEAERMLVESLKHKSDSTDMAEDYNSAASDDVADAVSFTSRANADTSRTYAKLGLLFLKALQFAADNELDCAEETNAALRNKQRTWRIMKKIVALADQSFVDANSALTDAESAAEKAEVSTKAAKKCIALVRDLNLQLENFEDICNDFIKEWKTFIDQDDDEKPSPI